jgi:GWxTD domain-containing protein
MRTDVFGAATMCGHEISSGESVEHCVARRVTFGGVALFLVLWNIFFVVWTEQSYAQQGDRPPAGKTLADSTRSDSVAQMLFGRPDARSTRPNHPEEKLLQAIVSAGAGSYARYRGLEYGTKFDPTLGVDFYLMPGGDLGFLLGGHFGFLTNFSTGIDLGLRVPIWKAPETGSKIFLDGSVLFFDNEEGVQSFQTGARLGLSRYFQAKGFGVESRLVGEFRGMSLEDSLHTSKPWWWAGIEVGISFSLIGEQKPLLAKDSLRAAMRHIMSAEELDDFDGINSESELHDWLERFWKKRDITPKTPDNEVREEFERRVEFANSRFSKSRRLGVDTDPGRTIVIYGIPDHEAHGTSTSDQFSEYMLWTYYQRVRGTSNAAFIFEALRGGEMRQVWSNVPGEDMGPIPKDLPFSIVQSLPAFVR